MVFKVKIEAISILRHTNAATMLILENPSALNSILAIAIRVKVRNWLRKRWED